MKGSISISEKAVLSIIEASEYSEIGQDRLKKLCDKPNCSFSFRVGNRRMIKKKEFDNFISNAKFIEEEDILIRQSYQMGYAEAERRVENAFQRGIHLGVSETVRSYERILSGKK